MSTRLSDSEIESIIRLRVENRMTIQEIAIITNRGWSTIQYRLWKHGIPYVETINEKKRGLAQCDAETRKRIATAGGKAISANKEHMRAIGSKGGVSVSSDREHMKSIGAKGGIAVSKNREHMARIGRIGGLK